MQKSYLSSVILAGVLIVLIGWYVGYEKNLKKKNTEKAEATKQLVSFDKDQIQELTLERKRADSNKEKSEFEAFKLKKLGSEWNLTYPVEDLADSSTVSSMVGTLTTTKQDRVVEEKPKELESYGLKDPLIKVSVRKDSTAPAEEIHIGGDTPVGYSVYVKVAGKEPIFKVSKSLKSGFEKDLNALRNKTIVSMGRFDIGEIEIQNRKENFSLKKDDKEQWQLTRENLPANTNEVNKTLNTIVELKAKDFASESGKDLEKFGLNSPQAKVWITSQKDKSRLIVWIGKHSGKYFAKREDKKFIYEVEKDILEKLERPAKEYRNLELANFNRFDVKRVKLERGKEILELLKEDSGWMIPTEPKVKVDESKVDGFLTKLQDTKIQQYLPRKEALKEAALILRLFEKKDNVEKEKLALKFGNPGGAAIRAERDGLELSFTIRTDDFKKIGLTRDDFIKKEDPPKPDSSKKDEEKKS